MRSRAEGFVYCALGAGETPRCSCGLVVLNGNVERDRSEAKPFGVRVRRCRVAWERPLRHFSANPRGTRTDVDRVSEGRRARQIGLIHATVEYSAAVSEGNLLRALEAEIAYRPTYRCPESS